MLRLAMRLLAALRPSPPRLTVALGHCTWCGWAGADSTAPDTGEPVHLNRRPYCQRQRDALAEQGRRS